jgi:hypothetical protein
MFEIANKKGRVYIVRDKAFVQIAKRRIGIAIPASADASFD